ncbi:MAG: hypothetical protein ACYC56_03405 [Candidatus Aquicultor sp.]
MFGTGPSEIGVLLVTTVIGLLTAIIPLAILIWLVVSIQGMKKSLRAIEGKLGTASPTSQEKMD